MNFQILGDTKKYFLQISKIHYIIFLYDNYSEFIFSDVIKLFWDFIKGYFIKKPSFVTCAPKAGVNLNKVIIITLNKRYILKN